MGMATMTLDELQAEFVLLGNEVAKAQRRRQHLLSEIEGRKKNGKIDKIVSGLDAHEKALLKLALDKP